MLQSLTNYSCYTVPLEHFLFTLYHKQFLTSCLHFLSYPVTSYSKPRTLHAVPTVTFLPCHFRACPKKNISINTHMSHCPFSCLHTCPKHLSLYSSQLSSLFPQHTLSYYYFPVQAAIPTDVTYLFANICTNLLSQNLLS